MEVMELCDGFQVKENWFPKAEGWTRALVERVADLLDERIACDDCPDLATKHYCNECDWIEDLE